MMKVSVFASFIEFQNDIKGSGMTEVSVVLIDEKGGSRMGVFLPIFQGSGHNVGQVCASSSPALPLVAMSCLWRHLHRCRELLGWHDATSVQKQTQYPNNIDRNCWR
jgi:hypothetical protein